MTTSAIVIYVACGLACLLFLYGSLHYRRKQRLLHDLPTSKTKGVFIGMVEVKGTAECTAPLTSYLARKSCVQYAWTVQEHWTRTTTSTDSKGNTTTKTETGWETVASGGELTLFFVQDDTGVLQVRPEGADIEPAEFFSETVSRGDSLYYAKGPATSVSGSDHRRLFTEKGIALHAEVFVVGQARERTDIVGAEIAKDKHADLFLVSTRTEEKVQRTLAIWSWFFFALGLIVAGGACYKFTDDLQLTRPVWFYLAEIAAAYFVLWSLTWTWMVFNSLINLRQRVRQGYSLVEIELKRRHDLLPALVATVSALSAHESDTQTAVAALRAQLTATPTGSSGPDYAGVATSVQVIVEKYPQLTAQPSFAALQSQLIETEQRIALARTYYNEIATHFTTRLEQIPERFIGALGAMRPEPLFTAANFEREAVTVKLVT